MFGINNDNRMKPENSKGLNEPFSYLDEALRRYSVLRHYLHPLPKGEKTATTHILKFGDPACGLAEYTVSIERAMGEFSTPECFLAMDLWIDSDGRTIWGHEPKFQTPEFADQIISKWRDYGIKTLLVTIEGRDPRVFSSIKEFPKDFSITVGTSSEPLAYVAVGGIEEIREDRWEREKREAHKTAVDTRQFEHDDKLPSYVHGALRDLFGLSGEPDSTEEHWFSQKEGDLNKFNTALKILSDSGAGLSSFGWEFNAIYSPDDSVQRLPPIGADSIYDTRVIGSMTDLFISERSFSLGEKLAELFARKGLASIQINQNASAIGDKIKQRMLQDFIIASSGLVKGMVEEVDREYEKAKVTTR